MCDTNGLLEKRKSKFDILNRASAVRICVLWQRKQRQYHLIWQRRECKLAYAMAAAIKMLLRHCSKTMHTHTVMRVARYFYPQTCVYPVCLNSWQLIAATGAYYTQTGRRHAVASAAAAAAAAVVERRTCTVRMKSDTRCFPSEGVRTQGRKKEKAKNFRYERLLPLTYISRCC